MINVNQITSQLARMPDPALQKYAEMHKNDPYVMALAMSEFNRRKQMRQGAQANAPEQPKVVDQAIQSMSAPMPEDVGIGQLPAGNMNFAEGGIVAFDEGGEVERYQDRGLVRPGPGLYEEDSKLVRDAVRRALLYRDFSRLGIPPSVVSTGFEAARAAGPAAALATVPVGLAQGLTSAMQGMRDQGYTADPMGEFGTGEATAAQLTFDEDRRRRAITAMSREERLRKFGTADVNLAMAGGAFSPAGREAAQRAQSAVPSKAAPTAADVQQFMDAGTRAASNAGADGSRQNRSLGGGRPDAGGPEFLGGPGANAAPAAGLASLPRMPSPTETYQSVRDAVPLVDPTAGMREDLGKEMVSGPKERLRKRQEEIAAEGDVFAGRGERIGRREAKLKDYESTNQSLALLNAGLAVMSTPGGLATALGKGARVGTEQYAAGLDKIRAAQERLEDAKDNLDTLRLNRADMNRKDIRSLEAEVDRAKLDSRKLGIEGLMLASDLREKQAGKVYDATMAQAKAVFAGEVDLRGRQIAADATREAARAPSGQERIAMALGGGNLETGLRKMAEIQAGKFDPKKAYTEYLVAAQKAPGADLLTYSQFIGQFAIPTVPGNNPAAAPGTVRERP